MKNFVQAGSTLSFIAAAAVASGAVVVVGKLAGVAIGKYEIGEQGEMDLTGVYTLPKVTDKALAPGIALYWDGTAITDVATSNTFIGHSAQLAEVAAATPSIDVRLAQSK
ncbi:capsid cement protein [Maritalea porphyrae]|uniref:capsid cement protein n=1 Tax=Maritalea porphyrae TaxID=880732 RepID=UPI0022B01A1C|nr:capsid cement protein [Maritalea porphyrae]MCZ4273997.1 DUF2190 family protein [Maritalea porphyrae]